MNPLVTPPEVRLIMTREAAKILGCSMSRVRSIAVAGLVKCWSLGPKSYAYDLEEIKRYRVEKEAGRKLGKVPGPKPQGFKAYISPPNRPKKKKK
jgi:hypothetical protein